MLPICSWRIGRKPKAAPLRRVSWSGPPLPRGRRDPEWRQPLRQRRSARKSRQRRRLAAGCGGRRRCRRRRCTAVGRGGCRRWCTFCRSDADFWLGFRFQVGYRLWPTRQQIGCPPEPLGSQELRSEAIAVALGQTAVEETLIVGRGGGGERQSNGPQTQLEQAIAARRLGVVVAFRSGATQDV